MARRVRAGEGGGCRLISDLHDALPGASAPVSVTQKQAQTRAGSGLCVQSNSLLWRSRSLEAHPFARSSGARASSGSGW